MLNYLKHHLSNHQKRILVSLWYRRFILRDLIFCRYHKLKWQADWRLYGLPIIQNTGKIEIGNGFTACSNPRYNSMGVFQRVTLKTLNRESALIVGDRVGVSGCSISAVKSIKIGNDVLVGTGALIVDNDAHPVDPTERKSGSGGVAKPVVIEDDVFIGARAIILKGVVIGCGSVIGAGSVVTRTVPPYSICAGNPAKIIGDSRRTLAGVKHTAETDETRIAYEK